MSVLVDHATAEHWKAAGKWVEFDVGQPPVDWTEPAPCGRCGGGGWDMFWDDRVRDWQKCPDCKGSGKQRLAVQVPCKVCGDMAGHGGFMMACCGATGRVTVAWATQEWGPCEVVMMDQVWRNHTHITVAPEAEHPLALWEHTGNPHMPYRTTTLTLPPDIDPASLIGQWARGGRIEAT